MVKLIAGVKGSGKSKTLIKIANEEVKSNSGNIIFLDNNDRNKFALNHDVRFTDISEYNIDTLDGFIGFISGMISRDFDIDTVFIDGLFKIVDIDIDTITALVEKINLIGDRYNIKFYLTVSHPVTELPSELEKYLY
ncbi:hypothetical protein QUF55_04125 [Clostridiaceae bacterium HSG29]|nr:hypothetical protein [Clostridiaceae bacterium HSG29]